MNEREENKELIRRIAETLRGHTEPYKDGAWERFAAAHARPQRRILWWPYWSAAAVVLVAVGLFWFTQQQNAPITQPQIVQLDAMPDEVPSDYENLTQEKVLVDAAVDSAIMPVYTPNERLATVQEKEQQLLVAAHTTVSQEISVPDTVGQRTLVDDTSSIAAIGAADTSSTPDPMPQRLAAATEDDVPQQHADRFAPNAISDATTADEVYAVATPKVGSGMEKWDFGLVVSPSLTSEKVNIGGGLAVAYRISDRLSIGSGIAINQLGVGENPNYEPRYNASRQQDFLSEPTPNNGFNGASKEAINYKREVSVTSSVVTLDIPLDLRYDVTGGFYTSVGLSYVTILNEQRTSHFVNQLNNDTFASGNSSKTDLSASTEFVYSSEKVAAQPLQGNGYAGFVNFSVGRKLPISSKLFLSVEPYFKLPIGRLSKEEMNFTNGGIRIVTGF